MNTRRTSGYPGESSRALARKATPELRPTHYPAPGLRAAREAAGLTVEELGERCGYGAGVVAALEAGGTAHSQTISRIAANTGPHDLRRIRDEGGSDV